MLTISTAVLSMSVLKNEIKEIINVQRRYTPTLYLFSEDTAIVMDPEEDPIVNSIESYPFPDQYGIFHTKITFNFFKYEQLASIHSYIRKTVRLYRPKVIGYVNKAQYKELTEDEEREYRGKKKIALLKDPTSIPVIQILLYAEGNKLGYSTTMPFLDTGKSKPFTYEDNSCVGFVDYPWYPAKGVHASGLENPYL